MEKVDERTGAGRWRHTESEFDEWNLGQGGWFCSETWEQWADILEAARAADRAAPYYRWIFESRKRAQNLVACLKKKPEPSDYELITGPLGEVDLEDAMAVLERLDVAYRLSRRRYGPITGGKPERGERKFARGDDLWEAIFLIILGRYRSIRNTPGWSARERARLLLPPSASGRVREDSLRRDAGYIQRLDAKADKTQAAFSEADLEKATKTRGEAWAELRRRQLSHERWRGRGVS